MRAIAQTKRSVLERALFIVVPLLVAASFLTHRLREYRHAEQQKRQEIALQKRGMQTLEQEDRLQASARQAFKHRNSSRLRTALTHMTLVKEDQFWLLTQTMQHGDLELARFLLDRGWSVAKETDLLYYAASGGNADICTLLLQRGWGNQADKLDSALDMAVCIENLKIVHLFLRRGANVNSRNGSPLWFAAMRSDVRIVTALLDAGASLDTPVWEYPDPKDRGEKDSNWTALMIASRCGQAGIVRLLLARHANVNHKSTRGQTALSLAKRYHHADIVALLKKAVLT